MTFQSATIVQRLWNYCNILRDDGMSYGDYVGQLTYLLFLKMADDQVRVLGKHSAIADTYEGIYKQLAYSSAVPRILLGMFVA